MPIKHGIESITGFQALVLNPLPVSSVSFHAMIVVLIRGSQLLMQSKSALLLEVFPILRIYDFNRIIILPCEAKDSSNSSE